MSVDKRPFIHFCEATASVYEAKPEGLGWGVFVDQTQVCTEHRRSTALGSIGTIIAYRKAMREKEESE